MSRNKVEPQNKGMEMERRNLKLLFFSPEASEIKSLNLGFKKLVISFFLLVLSILVLTSIFSFLVIKFYNHYKISQLHKQNSILVTQLANMQEKVDALKNRMKEIEKFDNDLRVLADLPKLDEEVRNVGVGGTVDPSDYALQELPLNLRNPSHKLNVDIMQLERQIDFQLTSFITIENKISGDLNKIYHTPSIRPVRRGRLKSKFGTRIDPFFGVPRPHYGIDISAEKGTPVIAPADGVVIEVNKSRNLNRDFGKKIWIDHGYGIKTLYGHLSKIDVKVGQKVKRGQKIGEVGRTGRSTGNHLHYQVVVNGKPVDPMNFIYEW